MIKTLIAEDDFLYSKNIINNVISQIDDIKIDYIATDGEEIINFISKSPIDLVLLDLEMTKINVIKILKQLEKLDIIKIPRIVIISKDLSLINNSAVSNIIIKSERIENVCKKIKEIVDDINYKTNYISVKAKVIYELTKMGYNLKYKGTKYIIDTIMYIYR